MLEQDISDLQRFGLLSGYFNEGTHYAHKRPKGSPDWLLMATVSGRGLAASGSVYQDNKQGDIVAFAPGTPHE